MVDEINFSDLEFERVPAVFHSTCGVPQVRSVRVGMPRIPHNVISGVFYLYLNREDAEAGRNPGGTGFIVRFDGTFVNGEIPGHHFYGVTNWHVACRDGYSTVRLNKNDGGTDVIEFGPEDWHFLPGKYDVAVIPLSLDGDIHQVSSISTHQFALDPNSSLGPFVGLGVGEDVFMIGLFIDHHEVTTNIPSARFGNISMLPSKKATIEQPTRFRGESFVVDMHSRTGFSGSPVYVYRTFGSDLTAIFGAEFDELEISNLESAIEHGSPMRGRLRFHNLFQLLGIHWGQFPEKWELRDKSKLIQESRRDLIVEGGYVEGMSGMTCVVPAWHIMEVFDMPILKKLRHPGIVAVEKARASEPKAESASPPASDANPTHREDFTRLVGAAARKPEPKD
jgi:hypothetical protein